MVGKDPAWIALVDAQPRRVSVDGHYRPVFNIWSDWTNICIEVKIEISRFHVVLANMYLLDRTALFMYTALRFIQNNCCYHSLTRFIWLQCTDNNLRYQFH